MGELFDIRITRNPQRQHRSESGGILPEEWLAVIDSDPSLEPLDHVWGQNPATGENIRIDTPNAAKWEQTRGQERAVFLFENGEITLPWASEDAQTKAREIAARLDASLLLEVD